jgi:uncharacterized membrane protein YfcA
MSSLIVFFISIGSGFIGALMGLGGGIIIVPVLTLIFGVNIRYAIAASLISIIATSSGAAASFLKDHLTNLRVAVLLEVGTVLGALTGFIISSSIKPMWLYFLFGTFLLFSSVIMFRKKADDCADVDHHWSKKLKLGGSYPNEKGQLTTYKVANVPLGLISMFFAGVLSALLGIGSGLFKVMAMDGAMKLPFKVSSATSNFMIGVTATASAIPYLMKGDVRYEIATPVALGIIGGSFLGARAMTRIPVNKIRKIFVVILLVVSVQMILKGIKG